MNVAEISYLILVRRSHIQSCCFGVISTFTCPFMQISVDLATLSHIHCIYGYVAIV